jgi:hypothetical protein
VGIGMRQGILARIGSMKENKRNDAAEIRTENRTRRSQLSACPNPASTQPSAMVSRTGYRLTQSPRKEPQDAGYVYSKIIPS